MSQIILYNRGALNLIRAPFANQINERTRGILKARWKLLCNEKEESVTFLLK